MFSDVIGVIFKYVTPPEDEPGAPSPFRFAESGSLSAELAEPAFIEIREKSLTLPTQFPGDPSAWWEWLVDLAAPVQTWMASMSEANREPEELGDGGRIQWVSGHPGEPPAYAGTDFIIARDGRIAAVYPSFDEPP